MEITVNAAAKATADYYDEKGVKYERLGDLGEIMVSRFKQKNRDSIDVIVIFDEDSTSAKIRSYNIAKFGDDKKEILYRICNELNSQYRWIKFYVDENDNSITAEDDAVIQLDSCGDEILRCSSQLVKIVDDTYPVIMKAIYG